MIDTALPVAGGLRAAPLAHWGLLRARGEDAASFLHGQLTQDILGLAEGQARLAGWCSPKGRLLASFVVCRTGPEEFLLACSADLLAGVLKRLSMFVLRARCRLSDAGAEASLRGLSAPAASIPPDVQGVAWPRAAWTTSAGAAGTLVRLDDAAGFARALWIGAGGTQPPAATDDTRAQVEAWDWLEVRSGVPRIVAATADAFVPQMVNFERVGGVNFQKGCYPGQEVVARSQYRGTVKRRMFLAACEQPARPGMEVYASADPGQPAGLVVLAAHAGGGQHAVLLEAKRDLVQAGTLHLGSADGASLVIEELPYVVPAEEG